MISYDYVPTSAKWAKLSRIERLEVARRYVADAEANRDASVPPGRLTGAQESAERVMRLALETPRAAG